MPTPTLMTAAASGLLISLSGSLPLGTLNLAALNIAAQRGWRKAAAFAIGAASAELVYLILILEVIDRVLGYRPLFDALQWVSVAVLLLLAASCFLATGPVAPRTPASRINGAAWAWGLALSAGNPLQLPFWSGWIVALTQQGCLRPGTGQSLAFAVAAFAGTLTAFALFIGIGRSLAAWLQRQRRAISFGTGFLLLGMAAWQLVTIFREHT